MTHFVFDTNVIVSALLFNDSGPGVLSGFKLWNDFDFPAIGKRENPILLHRRMASEDESQR